MTLNLDKKKFTVIHRNGEPNSDLDLTLDPLKKALVTEDNLIDVMLLSKFYKNNLLDKNQKPR